MLWLSQVFEGARKSIDVGVIATFGKLILLPINRRGLQDGSFVISLQYRRFWEA